MVCLWFVLAKLLCSRLGLFDLFQPINKEGGVLSQRIKFFHILWERGGYIKRPAETFVPPRVIGGSMWESNPPKQLFTTITGFETRGTPAPIYSHIQRVLCLRFDILPPIYARSNCFSQKTGK